jgi:hypothetical protein
VANEPGGACRRDALERLERVAASSSTAGIAPDTFSASGGRSAGQQLLDAPAIATAAGNPLGCDRNQPLGARIGALVQDVRAGDGTARATVLPTTAAIAASAAA